MTKSRINVLYYIYLGVSLLLWGIYVYVTFTAPLNQQSLVKYNLEPIQSRLLSLTIVLPFALTWFFGLYAVNGIRKYVALISNTVEGGGLAKIGTGVAALIFGLVFNSTVGAFRAYYRNCSVETVAACEEIIKNSTILTNYVSVIAILVSAILLFKGSWQLLKTTDGMPKFRGRLLFPSFTLAMATLVYLFLFFLNPIRQFVDQSMYPDARPTYYLSDPITLTTIIFPYIIAWALGLAAAIAIEIYRENVQGTFYRDALRNFISGFLTIVMTSIVFQIVTAIGYQFREASLGVILLIVYFLLAILGLGYVFMAIGAKRLRKIETV